MRSTITAESRTVIPAAIRNQFRLTQADHLEWIVHNNTLRAVPVRKNPIDAFRGQSAGGAT